MFDFKDSVNYAAGDAYQIVFPSNYDYFLGDVWTWLSNEQNVYYIDCSSTQLGIVWCAVNHNVVTVTGSNTVTGSTEIIININSVVNPPNAQTGNFQIYHINSSGAYLTVAQTFGTVTPLAVASGKIDVRSLVQTDNRIFKPSDYTWRIYITDVMNTDSTLQVLFPKEYDLNTVDQKSSYSCSSTWLDNSASATIKTQQSWNSGSSCTASGNLVTLSAPTTSITFDATRIVTWTLQAVGNPQWGEPRIAQTTTIDFDVTDKVLWPLYQLWVSKFTFFVYRTSASNLFHSSRSYHNINAAYAGFYDGYRPLTVNTYNPLSKINRIVVYAGTQTTDLYLSTGGSTTPMAAKQIVFTPTTNGKTPDSGKLLYTSVTDNFILFQSFYQMQFRVAAAIDMVKGLYYINWSNNETKQTGVTDVQYDIPANTLVEVIAKVAGQYTFAVSNIPNISTGYTSVPIKVTITNAPHADVTVNIAVVNTPANISVNPTAITFNPDVNVKYFQIQVASNYDLTTLGTIQKLSYTLTGTSSYAYAIAATQSFTITQSPTTVTTGNIVSWGIGTTTKTTSSVTPSSDQVGVIYYQLAASGNAIPAYTDLKASVTSLINANNTSTTSGLNGGSNTQSDPATGESWTDFQRRIYKAHLQTKWTGSISMTATTAVTTLTFNFLYANTVYQIAGYLDNLSSSSTSPAVRTETITTTAQADVQPFTLSFSGLVLQSFSIVIAQNAANVMGVNPLRIFGPTYTTSGTGSRVLQTTTTTSTFVYTLVPTDSVKLQTLLLRLSI